MHLYVAKVVGFAFLVVSFFPCFGHLGSFKDADFMNGLQPKKKLKNIFLNKPMKLQILVCMCW